MAGDRAPVLRPIERLGPTDDLESAAALAGQGLQVLERAVRLVDLGAFVLGADEEGSVHGGIVEPPPDGRSARGARHDPERSSRSTASPLRGLC